MKAPIRIGILGGREKIAPRRRHQAGQGQSGIRSRCGRCAANANARPRAYADEHGIRPCG